LRLLWLFRPPEASADHPASSCAPARHGPSGVAKRSRQRMPCFRRLPRARTRVCARIAQQVDVFRACARTPQRERPLCRGTVPRRDRTAQFSGAVPSLGGLAMKPHSQHLGCNASGSVAPQGPATSPQRQCSMDRTAPKASPHDQLWSLVPQFAPTQIPCGDHFRDRGVHATTPQSLLCGNQLAVPPDCRSCCS